MTQKYEAGIHIRYGSTGICLIDRIEDVPYPGAEPSVRRCYILKPVRNACMEISVPLDNEMLCGRIQPLRSKEEIDRLLAAAVQEPEMPWEDDRKARGAAFKQILAGGDAAALLRMIRCIFRQRGRLSAAGRHLSSVDDNACRDAERMLDEEFAFSLGVTEKEAGRYIRNAMKSAE